MTGSSTGGAEGTQEVCAATKMHSTMNANGFQNNPLDSLTLDKPALHEDLRTHRLLESIAGMIAKRFLE